MQRLEREREREREVARRGLAVGKMNATKCEYLRQADEAPFCT
jgi:hypothetical protein